MVQSLGHGGCERDAAKIAMGLDRERFDVHVGVLRDGGFRMPEVISQGIPVTHFPVTSFMNASVLQASRAMGAYIRRFGIKLIHCFDPPTDIFGAPTARWNRVPSLLTSQLSYRELCLPRERALLRISDRLADRVVVNSKAVGESLVKDASLPREKLFLCYNGVDTTIFYPGESSRPPELRDASVVIGSVCVMRPEKRVDWVVRSFATVFRVDPKARLMLVGSGPEVPKLEQLATELGIRSAVLFVPGQADVAGWLRGMDIYINSSRSESFPNALLEAMACGCAVIGSEVGGIPELIADGVNGFVFPVNDPEGLTTAMKRLAEDEELRRRFSAEATRTARERFSMRVNLDRMEGIYTELLDQRSC
jgi:L-malate glycosyltransferase